MQTQVEKVIKTYKHKVAALIAEPIMAEGGDMHASKEFFQGIQWHSSSSSSSSL
jgi:4-aminobutyrate aminotransferase-like enzyme